MSMSTTGRSWQTNPMTTQPGGTNPLYEAKDASKTGHVQTATSGDHTFALNERAHAPAPSVGDRLKAAFSTVKQGVGDAVSWLKNRVSTNRPDVVSDPAKRLDLVKTRPEYKALVSNQMDFNGPAATPSFKNAVSYARVRQEADAVKTNGNALGTFLRDGNIHSRISANIGLKSNEMTQIALEIRTVIGTDPVILNKASMGYLASETNNNIEVPPKNPSLLKQWEAGRAQNPDFALDRQGLARSSVAKIDTIMCGLFGKPGDAASVKAAANRLPQELCDQLAVAFKAIDDAELPPDTTKLLKVSCARDMVLRTINPALTSRPDILRNDSPDLKASVMQVSKAIQNLVNGVGISASDKDEAPTEIHSAGQHMKTRWDPALEAFASAVAARGDATMVAHAAVDGLQLSDGVKAMQA